MTHVMIEIAVVMATSTVIGVLIALAITKPRKPDNLAP
jgi:hypothetical protein